MVLTAKPYAPRDTCYRLRNNKRWNAIESHCTDPELTYASAARLRVLTPDLINISRLRTRDRYALQREENGRKELHMQCLSYVEYPGKTVFEILRENFRFIKIATRLLIRVG